MLQPLQIPQDISIWHSPNQNPCCWGVLTVCIWPQKAVVWALVIGIPENLLIGVEEGRWMFRACSGGVCKSSAWLRSSDSGCLQVLHHQTSGCFSWISPMQEPADSQRQKRSRKLQKQQYSIGLLIWAWARESKTEQLASAFAFLGNMGGSWPACNIFWCSLLLPDHHLAYTFILFFFSSIFARKRRRFGSMIGGSIWDWDVQTDESYRKASQMHEVILTSACALLQLDGSIIWCSLSGRVILAL
jgi:hypothetical protein